MTIIRNSTARQVSIADAFATLLVGDLPFRFTAYDGSSVGPEDATLQLHLKTERGLSYLVTAPGDLGLARAYVSGDLDILGVHPGNPYDAMMIVKNDLKF